MGHDENNALQRKYFAIDDLKRAAHLIERSIGTFAEVDDKNLTTARLLAERQHARRHLVDHAAKGQLAPRRVLKAVEPAPDAHEITDRMIGGGR